MTRPRRVVLNGDPPLSAVLRWLRNLLSTGETVLCPCCDQQLKVYSRNINAVMARQLAYLSTKNEWTFSRELEKALSVAEDRAGDREHAKLRYWGLVEDNTHGYWRITQRGRDFLNGAIELPRFAYVLKGKALFHSTEAVSYAECLETPFSLNVVMDPSNTETP